VKHYRYVTSYELLKFVGEISLNEFLKITQHLANLWARKVVTP